jgi:hypothetical protein
LPTAFVVLAGLGGAVHGDGNHVTLALAARRGLADNYRAREGRTPFFDPYLNEALREYAAKTEAWKNTLVPVTFHFALTRPVLAVSEGEREQGSSVLFPLRTEVLGLPPSSNWIGRVQSLAGAWPSLACIGRPDA